MTSIAKFSEQVQGLKIPMYDYAELDETDAVTETVTFYMGGSSSGVLVATLVVVYQSSAKTTLASWGVTLVPEA